MRYSALHQIYLHDAALQHYLTSSERFHYLVDEVSEDGGAGCRLGLLPLDALPLTGISVHSSSCLFKERIKPFFSWILMTIRLHPRSSWEIASFTPLEKIVSLSQLWETLSGNTVFKAVFIVNYFCGEEDEKDAVHWQRILRCWWKLKASTGAEVTSQSHWRQSCFHFHVGCYSLPNQKLPYLVHCWDMRSQILEQFPLKAPQLALESQQQACLLLTALLWQLCGSLHLVQPEKDALDYVTVFDKCDKCQKAQGLKWGHDAASATVELKIVAPGKVKLKIRYR